MILPIGEAMDWPMIPADCPRCGAALRETDGTLRHDAVANISHDTEDLVCMGCDTVFARWDYLKGTPWRRVDG